MIPKPDLQEVFRALPATFIMRDVRLCCGKHPPAKVLRSFLALGWVYEEGSRFRKV